MTIVGRLNELQRRRGPDGDGLWLSADGRVALGHRRLAIIDTGPLGAQPMSEASGRWTVTFNGEIYNYRALRHELEQLGCVFLTNSDTEVLLNAVARWGEAGLRKLRGMYAFALWDGRERELWLARDPYGIKPLYFAQCDGILWFASQARALARAAPVDAGEMRPRLPVYLWGHVPALLRWSGIRVSGRSPAAGARWRRQALRGHSPVEETYIASPRAVGGDELRDLLRDSIRHHLG